MKKISLLSNFVILFLVEFSLGDVDVYEFSEKLIDQYDGVDASFGPSVSSDGLQGFLLTTVPPNACKPISPPPMDFPLPKHFRWIALVSRTKGNDTCDFDLKASNVQSVNFSAMIVYNYEDKLITMGGHGRNVKIPSSMISLSNGKLLINNYLFNSSFPNFYVKVLPDDPFQIKAYFIPFAIVISVILFILILAMVVRCILQLHRSRRHRLPRPALKQLKTKKFVKGDRWEVCAICLDDFVEGAKLRILPCDHAYHMKCIDPWLLDSRRQCPVCKRYVFGQSDRSDGERTNGRTNDERTPLLLPATTTTTPIQEDSLNNPTTTINVSNRIDDSSDSDFPFPIATTNRTRRSFFSRLSTRRSTTSSVENSSSVTTYGAVHENVNNGRSANFFVGSISGTTDNTNASVQSLTDNRSDIETIDDDDEENEQMHSVLASSESNPAYVNDDDDDDESS